MASYKAFSGLWIRPQGSKILQVSLAETSRFDRQINKIYTHWYSCLNTNRITRISLLKKKKKIIFPAFKSQKEV